tara:strand:- start:532 stop:768 length:237 start_codon:yes stop_codon:yes gene_type:complete
MDKVMKESFYEASVRVDEEFENAELAVKSNTPSENSRVTVLDLKHEMSRIKNKLKEQDGSKKNIGIEASAGGGIKKDE